MLSKYIQEHYLLKFTMIYFTIFHSITYALRVFVAEFILKKSVVESIKLEIFAQNLHLGENCNLFCFCKLLNILFKAGYLTDDEPHIISWLLNEIENITANAKYCD